MNTPLQVSFHGLPPSAALEHRVRQSVAELESLFDPIVSCRVVVESPHRHQHKGRLYRVRVEIGVRGARVVTGHSPDERAAHADPYVALRDAFRAAERRLEAHTRRRRDERAAFPPDAP